MSPTMARTPQPASALPPGPKAPAWWQLVRFAGDPLGLLDDCRCRYGDAFTLHVAGNGRFEPLAIAIPVQNASACRTDACKVYRGDPHHRGTPTRKVRNRQRQYKAEKCPGCHGKKRLSTGT
jgi:hypothetical protein